MKNRPSLTPMSIVLILVAVICLLMAPSGESVETDAIEIAVIFVSVAVVTGFAIRNFWSGFGNGICIAELVGLVAVVQYLTVPALVYMAEVSHFKYYMYVDPVTYFSYAVPGTILFLFGLAAGGGTVHRRGNIGGGASRLSMWKELPKNSAWFTMAVGLSAYALLKSNLVPGSLNFLILIVANFRFAAALMFMMNGGRMERNLLPALVLAEEAYQALNQAMFHVFFLWLAMFSIFYISRGICTRRRKWLIVSSGVALIVGVLSVKVAIRELVWRAEGFQVEHLKAIQKAENRDSMDSILIRLNQGWIISRLLQNVPRHVDFVWGETIVDAVVATIFPRAILSDKVMAGGRTNFLRFTDLGLSETTAMGISPLGEAYCNFGRLGGCALMYCFGYMFRLILKFLGRMSQTYPLVIYFLPCIFLHAIKAETDFFSVMNFVFKSTFVVFLYCYFLGPKRIINSGKAFGVLEPVLRRDDASV